MSRKAETEFEKIARGFYSNAIRGGLLKIDSLIPDGEKENGGRKWKTTSYSKCAPMTVTLLQKHS